MRILVRAGLVIGILLLGAADVLVYWNAHLFYRSEKTDDAEKKIEILRRANSVYPLNDLAYYELGKACFDKSLLNPWLQEESGAALAEAVRSLERSVKLNAFSPSSHFYLGQALFIRGLLSPGTGGGGYIEQYKKAAELASPNTQISFEVGKALVSRWPELQESDRSKALELAKEVFNGKNRERVLALMNTWEISVGDLAALEKLLPPDAETYRLFADFLAEKGLSVEVRQRALARAEFFEFEKAKADAETAERDIAYRRWEEAAGRLKPCLDRLKGIHFYQRLVSESWIEPVEFTRLQAAVLLNLAKCQLELGKGLAEVEGNLREYLGLEDREGEVEALADYLVGRRFLSEKASARFDDLGLLGFQLFLCARQNRYAEIINVGRLLKESFVVIPGEKKADYVRVLKVIGDAHQRAGNLYEADDFYQRASELDPQNLEILAALRKNYESLNNEEKIKTINKRIEEMTAGEINLSRVNLEKGRSFSQPLMLDGRTFRLDLRLAAEEDIQPLLAVYFNDRVVWEDFARGGAVALSIESRVGKNMLRITALNRPVSLSRLSCRPGSESET